MKLNKKKGFTIIELVIVIAVIGVLTAILVPVFVNLTARANEARDQSLVKNLNTALKMEEQTAGHKKATTLQGAIDDLDLQGFSLETIVAKSGQDLLWDQEKNEFLLNKDSNLSGAKYWQIVDAIPAQQRFSYYASQRMTATAVSGFIYGFDMGNNANIKTITYEHASDPSNKRTVAIRASGDQTQVNVYAPTDDVNFYGFASKINVAEVAPNSLHVYGSANQLALVKGNVEIESTGIIFNVVQLGEANVAPGTQATSKIVNKGYIADATFTQHNPTPQQVEAAKEAIKESSPDSKAVGGNYEIATVEQLEAFRDAVNAGNSFAALNGKGGNGVVKLTANLELKDGWKPIGEGSRKPAAYYKLNLNQNNYAGTAFNGTFDGGNYTISNLNNTGFRPTSIRLGENKSGENITSYHYVYGLFAVTSSGAEIKNLKLTNVAIDGAQYTSYNNKPVEADSFGAVVGYSTGSLKIDNVHVLSGSIKATDAVGGLVGRSYRNDGVTTAGVVHLTNCSNAASITATGNNAGGLLGYAASYTNLELKVESCTNNANILANQGAAGIAVYSAAVATFNSNTNNGNITSRNNAIRGAHIGLDISGNKTNTWTKPTHDATNVAGDNATVTVRAGTTVPGPDTESCDHLFVYARAWEQSGWHYDFEFED